MLKAMSSLSYYSSPHLVVPGSNMLKAHALYTLCEYCRIHRSHASRVPAGRSGSGTGGASAPGPDLPWLAGTYIAYRVIIINKGPGMPPGMGHRRLRGEGNSKA